MPPLGPLTLTTDTNPNRNPNPHYVNTPGLTACRNSQRLVSTNFHQTGGHLPSRRMAGTKLYCLVAKTHACERFAEVSCPKARRSGTALC